MNQQIKPFQITGQSSWLFFQKSITRRAIASNPSDQIATLKGCNIKAINPTIVKVNLKMKTDAMILNIIKVTEVI